MLTVRMKVHLTKQVADKEACVHLIYFPSKQTAITFNKVHDWSAWDMRYKSKWLWTCWRFSGDLERKLPGWNAKLTANSSWLRGSRQMRQVALTVEFLCGCGMAASPSRHKLLSSPLLEAELSVEKRGDLRPRLCDELLRFSLAGLSLCTARIIHQHTEVRKL